ncbi:MAG TPA: ABC transporter ATP-binding protein [Woeseiaceae bacterium]|nr:ABC transporter ATP-binding protein [Woeseiaceae bacterium]
MTYSAGTPLLELRELSVSYEDGPVVDKLSFSLHAGEALSLAGESGSGKSQTALAIMGLLPTNAKVSGQVLFDGHNLLGAGDAMLNEYRARRMAMVFQDPMAALNPYVTIGNQLRRILLEHRLADKAEARRRSLAMLKRVGLPDAERQYSAYPHELSGGMRQRALIAAALIAEPRLLIADEPTTALDVTVQAQILRLLAELRQETNVALLLITHDLGVVSTNCERLMVIDKGQLIEQGATREVFANPSQPRTAKMVIAAGGLIGACSPLPATSSDGKTKELLEVQNLSVTYLERTGGRRRRLHAVHDISLSVRPGETVAIVGESGSGKSSLARAVVGLLPEAAGSVSLAGETLQRLVGSRTKSMRRKVQMVFQDPVASLDPAMPVGSIVAEPLLVHEPSMSRTVRTREVTDMLLRVGLTPELMTRYAHELSGGQAQRVAIARALILKPALLICDEAVAALDSAVRLEVLGLLQAEQQRAGLALLVITHDLSVVQQLSHRVLIMYMGRLIEVTEGHELFRRPRHPYSRLLLDSIPLARKSGTAELLAAAAGEPASILVPPTGCVFHPRCAHRVDRCREQRPELLTTDTGAVACHRAAELDLSL